MFNKVLEIVQDFVVFKLILSSFEIKDQIIEQFEERSLIEIFFLIIIKL